MYFVDIFLSRGMDICVVFVFEYGFWGDVDAGEKIIDVCDFKIGLFIILFYGKYKELIVVDLVDIDMLVFDIQDVGVCFYMYIFILYYVMQVVVKYGKEVMVLDCFNLNGYFFDGLVFDLQYQFFVGMYFVFVVYGMMVVEYVCMINGEGWLEGGKEVCLMVNCCVNYDCNELYILFVKLFLNLLNMWLIYFYFSFCFFEGIVFSVGRGIDI